MYRVLKPMEVESEIQLNQGENGVSEIVLNRPERKNAITGPFGQQLAEAFRAADADVKTRVILLRGADGAFCSGLDLGEFNADPAPEWLSDFQHIWRGAHRALFEAKKPIVGALEQYAINGGAALALACDLLVAGEEAFLQVGEVKIGMAAPYNMAWLNLRHAEALAAQIALVGERLSGKELKRMGVAHQVAPDSEVLVEARSLAASLAAYPEGGLLRIKAGIRARLTLDADAWFDQFTGPDPVGGRPQPSSMKKL